MIVVSNNIAISDNEYVITAIHSQGPGGQNVNKVSTAIQLRFDITNSSLPENYKEKLLKFPDSRVTKDGEIVIKAQNYRSQIKNREDAETRLRELILNAVKVQKKRKPTKPTTASRQRRRLEKTKRSEVKKMRGKFDY